MSIFCKNPVVFKHNCQEQIAEDIYAEYVVRHTADKIIPYKTVNGEALNLCCFFPKDYNPKEKYPLFVAIHGGGWNSRNIMKDQKEWSGDYLGYLLRYYADKGFLGIIMTYGILEKGGESEKRQLIDIYEDCQDAMNFIADHAKEYGGDTDRVILLGESAGGHLAGAMATNSFYENRLTVRTAILVNPILNLLNDKWGSGCLENSSRPLLKDMCKEEMQMLYSPLMQIKPDNCNVLLIHGSADSVVDVKHSILFNRRMAQMGLKSELHIINGAEHAFLLREYYKYPVHTKMAVEVIDNYLAEDFLI